MSAWDTIQPKEVYRYLGIHNNAADSSLAALVEKAIERVRLHMTPRYVAKEQPLLLFDQDISIGDITVQSADLAQHLRGCESVIVFAATLGSGIDRLLQRDVLSSPSLAVVEQAVCAAFMEAYADDCCQTLALSYGENGRFFRPRFSPGYGDFSLHTQEHLLRMLDAGKHIALSVTASQMLTPVKSITAVIGVSTQKQTCYRGGCLLCNKQDCLFRKEENN